MTEHHMLCAMDTQPQYLGNDSNESDARTAPDMTGEDRRGQDMSGHVTVDMAMLVFLGEGLPRNKRSIRRYCERGDIECTKVDTENGQRYMLDEQSLMRFIEQQKQIYTTAGSERTEADSAEHDRPSPAVSAPVQAPTPAPDDTVTFLKEQLKQKDAQIEKKDEQIKAMLERDRETNVLIKELQGVVQSAFHLLGSGRGEERDSAGHGRTYRNDEPRSIPVYSDNRDPNRDSH
jgi:hypothetical protein